jgi:hypothetical protein
MSVSELKQRLHFAVDKLNDEDFLKDLLLLLESPSKQHEFATMEQWKATREKEKILLRSHAKARLDPERNFSLKDRYCFEERAY